MRDTVSIIEQIESLLLELKMSLGVKRSDRIRSSTDAIDSNVFAAKAKLKGVSRAISDLADAGFFDEPRGIMEIQQKLRDEGINKPTTGLMSPLLRLIRKRILERQKSEKGLYKYIRR